MSVVHTQGGPVSHDRHATWLELFYDLVYVILIARLTHIIMVGHNGHVVFSDFVTYTLLFVPVWWAWTGHTLFETRFGTDDAIDRILTLIQMFLVLLLAVFITDAAGKYHDKFALSYGGIRIVLVCMYLRILVAGGEKRAPAAVLATGFGLGALLWLVSVFVEPPLQFGLWAVGLGVDMLTPLVSRKILRRVSVHRSHLPERTGLLVIILMGEAVSGIVSSSVDFSADPGALLQLLLMFMLMCAVWWLYFETMEKTLMGRLQGTAQLHIYGHLFIYLGLGIFAAAIRHLLEADFTSAQLGLTFMAGLLMILVPMLVIHHFYVVSARRRAFMLRALATVLAIIFVGIGAAWLPVPVTTLLLLTILVFALSVEARYVPLDCTLPESAQE